MQEISSKSHFLKTFPAEEIVKLANNLNSPIARSAMIFLTAHMCEQRRSQEQIVGAMTFRDLLLNIAELPTPLKPLPVQSLKDVTPTTTK